ncbi:hypothetical protein MKX67_18855 [Cytobacillus sp. FSL W7-1323]|uniref:Uncharacterized protein n=1 Tax=Cytobacillus kochii TaxID=859143 RepID=A0A248TK55_9BACI|nr:MULTISPECIES: hypothetical protein [Cytobacillus]ASV68512.1 hypothetical protein CKF48_15085 [Cytobacillus kochii]MEA1855270.1 hypothetical protein [Cytobacillus sp. OWB-43]
MIISGEKLVISGAIILAIGAVVEGIGQTESSFTGTDLGKDLIVEGNSVEAFGNSLQAVGRTLLLNDKREVTPSELYTITGAWLEAAGNTGNAVGISIELSGLEEDGILIDTLGSEVQGLGAGLEAYGAYISEDSNFRALGILGNGLISFGSFVVAIGNIFILNNFRDKGDLILFIGSWLQVIGSFILIFAINKEFVT